MANQILDPREERGCDRTGAARPWQRSEGDRTWGSGGLPPAGVWGLGPHKTQTSEPCSRFPRTRLTCERVRDTGIEPVTSSVSGKRSPAELIARGGDGIRTRVHGFAGRCLASRPLHRARPREPTERMTGFEPATLTLAR